MLKYALRAGQNELYSALFITLLIELGMDFDNILSVMRDIMITENKTFLPMPAAGD